ncbi:OmpA family protein [Cellulomonas chitinilytica]|nr:OmpA family protein [Cellulomonas chitinilytica]
MVAMVVAALAGATLLSGASAPADEGGVPSGVVEVDGQEVPVLGTFAYHQRNTDTNPAIRGLVHGVRRIDGGTVLYYSIGWDSPKPFEGWLAYPDSSSPYKILHATDVQLVDTAGLAAYRPLASAETTFTTLTTDLDSEGGELRVAWAVFPELPPDVTEVQVTMPYGTASGVVPVEDGALEPVGKDPAPYVGEGWPKLPTAAELATADPATRTFPLARRTEALDGATKVLESPENVAVTLDANVLFASGSAELTPQASETLATVAADIAARGTGQVVVTGHTDSDGSDAFNQTLSEQRAQSVLAVLQPISGTKVTFVGVGKGETEPVAPNSTDEGKQANRRVTIVYGVGGNS